MPVMPRDSEIWLQAKSTIITVQYINVTEIGCTLLLNMNNCNDYAYS